MEYHKLRYRTDEAFRQRELDRAKAYYAKADPIRLERIRLSKNVYKLGDSIELKKQIINDMEVRLAEMKSQLESLKWQIHAQKPQKPVVTRKKSRAVYFNSRIKAARQTGHCTRCFKNPTTTGSRCDICRSERTRYQREKRAKEKIEA